MTFNSPLSWIDNLGGTPMSGWGSMNSAGTLFPKPDNRPEGLSYCEGAGHYFGGNGEDVTIPFSSIDPGWGLSDFGVDGCAYDEGSHEISENKVTETLADGIGGNEGPGQVTIFLDGTLVVSKDSNDCKIWSFEGTVSPEATNRFDFNKGNRGFPREQITTIIRTCGPALGGQDFDMQIEGNRSVSEDGDCDE